VGVHDSGKTELLVVAGLGNPGSAYHSTRHNIGFRILDHLARRAGGQFSFESRWNAEVATFDAFLLVKPMTFMNRSGESVAGLARFRKIAPEQILVVVDDVALPFGRLRLRKEGSDGGHNGLASLTQCLGSSAFPRLRVGVDSPLPTQSLESFVLSRFTADEEAVMNSVIDRAADAVELAFRDGMDSAMNTFNQNPSNQKNL